MILTTMLINRLWWDINFHAAILLCCVALLGPVSLAVAVGGMLALLVGLSRILLRQHMLPQVLAGWALGFGLTSYLFVLATQIYLRLHPCQALSSHFIGGLFAAANLVLAALQQRVGYQFPSDFLLQACRESHLEVIPRYPEPKMSLT